MKYEGSLLLLKKFLASSKPFLCSPTPPLFPLVFFRLRA